VIRTNLQRGLLLGFSHFFVDFACTALLATLTTHLSALEVAACALLYNGLAFAFQLPIGALADKLRLHRDLAALGCLLTALGALFSQPLILCCLIGIGNACFHVGGGREALKQGRGTASFVGCFVAPGAIGIFLGPRLWDVSWLTKGILPGCLLFLCICLFLRRAEGRNAEQLTCGRCRLSSAGTVIAIGCMFLTVLLRSYMGTVLQYTILSGFWPALLFTISIFAGKFLGGALADRFGALPFNAFAQLLAVALFTASVRFQWLAFPAIFLFNTTMATTATQLYRCMPQFPGTMFGLTTFALYLGVVPRLLGLGNPFFTWWGLGALSLVSALLLLLGLYCIQGGVRHAAAASPVAGSFTGADTAP